MIDGHDFGCIRAHNVAKWRRDKEHFCWQGVDMEHQAAVEILSSQMEIQYNCNLNYVSSEAIKSYMILPEKTDAQKALKKKVLEMIVAAIKSNKNPFTGRKFGHYGMTQQMVDRIIKFCKTGDHTPKKVRVDIEYTKEEFELLGHVFERMLRDKSRCPDHMGDSVLISLQKRLMPPRARLLFGGEL
ncbi:MAG: hypothetical protein WC110_12340 [Bacteroidales bacterium]|jgi:hypothetical protein